MLLTLSGKTPNLQMLKDLLLDLLYSAKEITLALELSRPINSASRIRSQIKGSEWY